MAEGRTAEEELQHNITIMGEELGRQYSALWQGVALLFSNWHEFVELFGTKPERVELLNSAAPGFFGMVQGELWDSILLGIARLTDRSTTAGRNNLTIRNLDKLVPDAKTKATVKQLIETAIDNRNFVATGVIAASPIATSD